MGSNQNTNLHTNPDMMRSARVPAQRPYVSVVQFQNIAVVSGLQRLTIGPIGAPILCVYVYIQADANNAGYSVIGGQNVALNSGMQVFASQAAVFAVDQSIDAKKIQDSHLPGGVLPGSMEVQGESIKVISLSNLWHVSSQDGQLLRVTYAQWTF